LVWGWGWQERRNQGIICRADDFEGDPARQRRFEGAQRLSGAVDIFCNLPSPNRTRIDFGGGDLVGGVDQRVLAMVGAGASKGTECFAFAHNVGSPVVPHRDLNTRAQ
jgi:hypothetical protein